MMQDVITYAPQNQEEWRQWLVNNHLSSISVWVVFYKKKSDKHNLTWDQAVDEALCFGWVDGRRKPLDDEKFIQFFCTRKANSTWSRVNKVKVADLIFRLRMMPAGLASVNVAKENGSWTILDDVEALLVPKDLQTAFEQENGTLEYYNTLGKSAKKMILQWVKLCKADTTRQQRIKEIVNSATLKKIPDALRR